MISITIKLIFDLAADKESHEIYELHDKYRLTPIEIMEGVNFLVQEGVIELNEHYFKLSSELSPHQLKKVYHLIRYRKLELDKQEIDNLIEKSKLSEELYKPNLNILDKTLKVE